MSILIKQASNTTNPIMELSSLFAFSASASVLLSCTIFCSLGRNVAAARVIGVPYIIIPIYTTNIPWLLIQPSLLVFSRNCQYSGLDDGFRVLLLLPLWMPKKSIDATLARPIFSVGGRVTSTSPFNIPVQTHLMRCRPRRALKDVYIGRSWRHFSRNRQWRKYERPRLKAGGL